jgi:hypothetical protein
LIRTFHDGAELFSFQLHTGLSGLNHLLDRHPNDEWPLLEQPPLLSKYGLTL